MSEKSPKADSSPVSRPLCIVGVFSFAETTLPSFVPGWVFDTAVTFPEPTWLWETVAWLSGLTLLWIMTEAVLRGLRRIRWMSHASSAKLARVARVAFGGSLVAALFLPYLADVAPTSALVVILAIAALTLPFIGGAAGVHSARVP